jgi:hypothetical protein
MLKARNFFNGETKMSQRYEVVVHGLLPPQWNILFEELEVQCLPDGNTCIAGSLPDQSALYGLLMRLRDFGLMLISVNHLGSQEKS